MTKIADSIAALSETFPAPGRLAEQRSAALAAFRGAGLPDTSLESWRYTDITGLENADLIFQPDPDPNRSQPNLLPIDADRIVFINGQLEDSLTQVDSAGSADVSILAGDWSSLADGFPRNNEIVEHPLGQLNTAASRHGVVLRAEPHSARSRTLHIVLMHSGNAALALQPRIVLDLTQGSSAGVVLHCVSDTAASGWMNVVVEIRQAADSQLELIQLQEHGSSQTHTSLISASLDRCARATIASFDLGAKLARNDVDIRLSGTGSAAETFGAFLPLCRQHIDTQVSVDHQAAHTNSAAYFRGIAGERSRGVFNSKVTVRPNAQKISAEQRSDNLLLAADAEIDTKPELEIYADDVKCSHGATVGELDDEHLFYLRSRGIDNDAARALLTNAFAQTVVDRINDAALREAIATRIAERLPEHERWEQLN